MTIADTQIEDREPATNAPPVLDPKDPMTTARMITSRDFTTADGLRTLWRHRGTFWSWTGSYYRLADDETLRVHAWNFLERAKRLVPTGALIPFRPTRASVGEVVEAMTAVCQLDEHLDPPAWLSLGPTMPPAAELFACANGLLHLPTGTLRASSPDFFCLNASTAAYDRSAPEPTLWLAFLRELFENDDEAIMTLQDWFGYTLSPDTSQQKIGGAIGPKRSGKGTITRVLTKLLGASSVAGPTMNSLGENFGLEPLITKSLATISDVRIGKRTDKSTIVERLLSISGEDQMTVARKFLKAWTGKLPTRIMISTNELPALTDSSGALAGRLIILVLTKSFFGREDPKLTEKLTKELPGILNWAIEGYRRLNERGHFIQPKSSRHAIADIETLGAPVKAFVRDCCVVDPGKTVAVDDTFSEWENWCARERRRDPGTREWFGRNLRSAVPGLTVTREGREQVRFYQGIGFNEETITRRPTPQPTRNVAY
jgi:putative DNA primase/helicase